MAAWFSPSFDGPKFANDTKFVISWNAPLTVNQLTAHWYQELVLAVGACAFILGWSTYIFRYLRGRRLQGKEGLWSKILQLPIFTGGYKLSGTSGPYQSINEKLSHSSLDVRVIDLCTRLSKVKSFSIVDDGIENSQPRCDMNILHMPRGTMEEALRQRPALYNTGDSGSWFSRPFSRISIMSTKRFSSRAPSRPCSSSFSAKETGDERHSRSPTPGLNTLHVPPGDTFELSESSNCSSVRSTGSKDETNVIRFGTLDLAAGLSRFYDTSSINECASHINKLRLLEGFDGLVLSYNSSDPGTFVNNMLRGLRRQNLPVILQGDPDSQILKTIDLSLASGIILENASILPSGRRRDFFEAALLRDVIARCKRQRKERPGFFIGFLEIWDKRPSAAVLRRAYKLADFFGAVVEARHRVRDQQTEPPRGICLSGFDWLKKAAIVQLQQSWAHPSIPSLSIGMSPPNERYGPMDLDTTALDAVIQSASTLMASHELPKRLLELKQEVPAVIEAPLYVSKMPPRSDFWNFSSCGARLCALGCYDLREEITTDHYEKVARVQRDLREHRMLHTPTETEMLRITDALRKIESSSCHANLLSGLLRDLDSGCVKVHKGLDSGFQLPDDGGHLWGISDVSGMDQPFQLDIYISLKNSNDAATIWHTYLAHHNIPRVERFEEELLLTRTAHPGAQLPLSIRQELMQSTEAEVLYLIEQLRISEMQHSFIEPIVRVSASLLITETTQNTWTALHSKACLTPSFDVEHMLQLRLEHHARTGVASLPQIENLVCFYEALEAKLEHALFMSDRDSLNAISMPLIHAYKSSAPPTPVVDLYGLIFFCALRRVAYEDVYLETTDRCPLFLSQTDQAGVFSELWVLGSQCEIYFGIQPRTLGEITYNRYRQRLERHPPPVSSWNGKDVFTAYSTAEPTIRVEGHPVMSGGSGAFADLPSQSPGWKSDEPRSTMNIRKAAETLGAMSIFCLPAIIDVVLLTFLGRGFYLTTDMNADVRLMANYAILTSLIMTGGVTGWVGSTGGFYLFSFAFDNMTHFLVQRFSAAFMLTAVVGLCGFFALSQGYSWFPAFIFLFYLFALTIFLNVLGMLATMHRPGSPLTSGRVAMWKCLTILFISPILSSFVNNHDLAIYMAVISTFVIVLLITFRNICHEWTTWQSKVPTIKEKDLLAWYKKRTSGTALSIGIKPSVLAASARTLLQHDIDTFNDRSSLFTISRTTKPVDEFVRKMVIGLPFALWLLEKESNGGELPERFTTTWFVQLELAFVNQRQLTRGLKEHSALITYRYSKYDLGQNIGLFLGALMDRLIDISMSARKPPVLLYYDDRAKYGICFGILYFLCGAVAVDIVLQHYWPFARALSDKKLTNIDAYKHVLKDEDGQRKQRYRMALFQLFTFLFMIFGTTTLLMWGFVMDGKAILTYFTAVSAYTGVLVFQVSNACECSVGANH